MPVGKILLIEDIPSNSRIIEVALRGLGLDVVIRADGASGLEAAHDPSVELVVLDIGLPNLDGWQVLDAIRSDPTIMITPVVVLTAHVEQKDMMRAADGGADFFMTKPFQPSDLRQVASALIERHRDMKTRIANSHPSP